MPPDWRKHLDALRPRLGPPLAVVVLFLLVPLVLFAPTTVGGRTMVPYDALVADPLFQPLLAERGIRTPQNGLVADLVYQNIAWKQYLADAGEDGEVPLWNSHILGGMPFLAAGQHSGLYPTSPLFLWLPPERAFGWNAVLTLWLAALAMYVLGRTLGLGRFASTLMGLSWSLSSLFVVNSVFPMIQAAMAWTPLILAGIEACARAATIDHGATLLPRGRAAVWMVVTGLATALTALAGHVEILYYSALVAAAFALFRIIGLARTHGPGPAIRLTAWLATAALSGGLLAGVQLIPLAELARTNFRSGSATYQEVTGFAFGLRQAVTFLIPDFFGNPAHHAVWDVVRGRSVSLDGDAVWGTAWGTKNYVEAAAYVGMPTLLLALIGFATARRRGLALFLAGLAGVSLTFVFGLPTYRVLFFGLPGFDQLHTPFRWVFPFALAVVVLAGLGAERLSAGIQDPAAVRWLGGGATALGSALAGVLGVAFIAPRRWVRLVERLLAELPDAQAAALDRFPSVDALASYEYWNLLHLALFSTLAGVAVLTLLRTPPGGQARRLGRLLMLGVVALDLALIGFGFNPAVDAELARLTPDTVTWLQDATAVKWGRVVGYGETKVLWPNTAMRFGVPDLRGYDSTMPRWTVETINAIEDQEGMLRFNRIGNLTAAASLGHPALAALGGRYVITTEVLEDPALELVHPAEHGARIYENTRAMPRAWVVNQVQVFNDRPALLRALASFDPASTVLLEEKPDWTIWRDLEPGRWLYRPAVRVRTDTEKRNSLEIEVYGATSGDMLVLSEGWFPGWRAWVETVGQEGEEIEVPVYRANGTLRAVPVPQGLSTVRLKYFPMSAKVGLYFSFLGAILMFLALAYALWTRFVRVDGEDAVGRVAVNSAGPMAAALLNKVIDFAFAMLMLRVLGPENAGKYYTAIVVIGFAEIFSNFGLNLLAAREVARRPADAPRYLTNTAVLRLLLWLLALPLLGGYVALRSAIGEPLAADTVLAIGLLAAALVPANLNAALTSIFQAFERMVLPAGVSIISTLLKVSLGALVLLAGYGFVGLAAVAIGVNWMTFAVLAALALRAGIRPDLSLSRRLLWSMVGISLPLMLNHLLQTVFFKIDVLLLDQIKGATVVGWYQAAYKWIDALLIIPAYFTMALFPLLSRRAEQDRAALERTYAIALRWLVSLALPIALITTVLAEPLVRLLAGQEYLPHGATALQIMIWFLPLSFANGLTQYVLIALDRQRWITLSFAVTATFNIVANWLVIPEYSYSGAAVVTILSEIVLLIPFQWRLRDLDTPPLLVLLWRPALATSGSALLLVALLAAADALALSPILAAIPILPVYVAALAALGGITGEDRDLLARLLGNRARTPFGALDG